MTILERLLRHDAWTTRALLTLSQPLSDAALDREFDIGHRTLRRTFVHIVENMESWHDLMAGVPRRSASGTTVARLIERLDVVAADLLSLGRKVTDEKREDACFIDTFDRPPRQKPFGAGLLHIATHGMHHRAQCLWIMRQLGMKNLIEGDALSWERSHLELQSWPVAS